MWRRAEIPINVEKGWNPHYCGEGMRSPLTLKRAEIPINAEKG
jgi:hypothetical protein